MDWSKLADDETINRTVEALKANKIHAVVVKDRREALETLVKLIPRGSEIMNAGSTTLNEIGFTDMLKAGGHGWINFKEAILAEKDQAKQHALRQKSTNSEYIIGSVHAVTEDGRTITASATGSQLPGYAYSSANVVWVVGAQKIVKDVAQGLKRIEEYCVQLEDKRMMAVMNAHTTLAKILIFNKEIMPRKITLILVKEKLGF